MELLITLIGNAAVDPNFRKRFLANPAATIRHYGFHLTKGEYEMMMTVFGKPKAKQKLEEAFSGLQDQLYANLQNVCPKPPCHWSIHDSTEVVAVTKKAA